jgi:hypothetical protein
MNTYTPIRTKRRPMPRITLQRQVALRLGSQDERAFRRSVRGRQLWEASEDGQTFASLFPDLVGLWLVINRAGIAVAGSIADAAAAARPELMDRPRLMLCYQWLQANGYV